MTSSSRVRQAPRPVYLPIYGLSGQETGQVVLNFCLLYRSLQVRCLVNSDILSMSGSLSASCPLTLDHFPNLVSLLE